MPKRLLVADDSATIQRVVQYSLSQEDVEIVFVRTAEEAYGKAREIRPDMLIVDTVLPNKSGYDLSRALKNDASMATMPILLLASANEPFDENKARAAGADGWIPKPFQTQALVDEVRRLFASGAQTARPPARPTQPPPVRPQSPHGAPTAPPTARPRPPTQPPPARPAAPPPGVATRPPPPRPPQIPATRPPPPRPGTMPPGTQPPPPRTPGPVATGSTIVPPPARPAAVTPANHEALLKEALSTASREMLEKVIWEVVPELAETIIREELERLIKAKQG